MSEIILTDDNFLDEVLNSKEPVLVDFFAPWCGPCKMMGPLIDELAGEMAGKSVKICKMNVDENPATAEKYGIMSIPTIIIFKNGEKAEQLMGIQDKGSLKEKLEKLM